jgi:hypothetical protein
MSKTKQVARFRVTDDRHPGWVGIIRVTKEQKNKFTLWPIETLGETPANTQACRNTKTLTSVNTIRSSLGFIEFIAFIAPTLDSPDHRTVLLESYREELPNGQTIEEKLKEDLRRQSYRLCHSSTTQDSGAWGIDVSGIAMTPEEALQKIWPKAKMQNPTGNDCWSVDAEIGLHDEELRKWALQNKLDPCFIGHELVLVKTTEK